MAQTKDAQMTATNTFVTEVDGVEHYVRTGDVVMASDPVAQVHKRWFRPVESTD
jgi:hypothetical protein